MPDYRGTITFDIKDVENELEADMALGYVAVSVPTLASLYHVPTNERRQVSITGVDGSVSIIKP